MWPFNLKKENQSVEDEKQWQRLVCDCGEVFFSPVSQIHCNGETAKPIGIAFDMLCIKCGSIYHHSGEKIRQRK